MDGFLLRYCNLVGSDSRSAGTIEDRIRPALESGSKVGSKRPVLVVIDEIDGATGGNDHVSPWDCFPSGGH